MRRRVTILGSHDGIRQNISRRVRIAHFSVSFPLRKLDWPSFIYFSAILPVYCFISLLTFDLVDSQSKQPCVWTGAEHV